MQDVPFFAVFVEQEGDAGVAIGVVFDRLDGSWNAVFVAAEVDVSIQPFVTASPVAAGDDASVVAALFGVLVLVRDFSGSDLVISAKSETVCSRVLEV